MFRYLIPSVSEHFTSTHFYLSNVTRYLSFYRLSSRSKEKANEQRVSDIVTNSIWPTHEAQEKQNREKEEETDVTTAGEESEITFIEGHYVGTRARCYRDLFFINSTDHHLSPISILLDD